VGAHVLMSFMMMAVAHGLSGSVQFALRAAPLLRLLVATLRGEMQIHQAEHHY